MTGLAVLDQLLDDPLTEAASLLRARVLDQCARALRRVDRPAEAARRAEQAVAALAEANAPVAASTEVLANLVMAHLEAGDEQRAEELAPALSDLGDDLPAYPRVTALWALAGVHYLAARPDRALELLDRADALLGSDDEIRLRTRLVRARALAAIGAGRIEDASLLVGQLSAVVALLGSPAERTVQAALEALAALSLGGEGPTAEATSAIDPDTPGLAPVEQAWITVVRARAHRAAGRATEAEADYRAAADRYEQAGAYRSATQVWRELSADGKPTGPETVPLALFLP
ncbi:hypothetical protein KV557_21785 [Kitasatospora aureofaciens]|uniref:hypothetical protein n=1 Tax=Kitasatospora aureofaciens TaxID=1894 RepID=UPI001C48A4E5|nr:hypothetical protein [Kitasatospora aureofaciens]MBV6699697.1 hypothetical protein [Kitasatospora aureofaciens]